MNNIKFILTGSHEKHTSIRGNVKEVAARTCIIMALKRKCYGYWRDKKAVLEQSIYKETLSNGQSSSRYAKVKFCNTSNGTEISLQIFNV
ncbi:hypothetical protein C6W24_17895 [Bacillus atrophaeus]|uniref:hypothetical protein n=1 Tax=Bacillus atrophaeus TaxID=1452 RepID=UPI000D0377B6|nr:hypothetical protein [Bacillus atrophaeus]PRR95287.1 hypothetical protein C6W24_17895 [Bacillus atrophaeus]